MLARGWYKSSVNVANTVWRGIWTGEERRYILAATSELRRTIVL